MGVKESRKIPAEFPANFSSEKPKNFHRRTSAGAQGEKEIWGRVEKLARSIFVGKRKIIASKSRDVFALVFSSGVSLPKSTS